MINFNKENLYKEIKDLGEATYFDWKEKRLSSKKIAKLSKPFLNNNLKTSYQFKINLLVFIYALQKRLNIRYKGFFKKLFRLFCYLKEKTLLKNLKALIGVVSLDFDKENLGLKDKEALKRLLLTEENDDDTKQGKKVDKQLLEQEKSAEKENAEEKEEKADSSKKVDEQKEQDEEITSKEDLQNKQVVEFKQEEQQVVVEINAKGEIITKEKINVIENPKTENDSKKIKEEPLNKQAETTIKEENATEKTEQKDSVTQTRLLDLDITAQMVLMQREEKAKEESQGIKLHIPPRFINENQQSTIETKSQVQKEEQKHVVPILLDGDKAKIVVDAKEKTEQNKQVKQNKDTETHNKIKVEEFENNARNKINDTVHETLSEDEILKMVESIKNTAELIMQQEEKKFKVYDADKHPKKQVEPKTNPIIKNP